MKNNIAYKNGASHLIIRYSDAISDPKLIPLGNRGRKASVTKIYENKERHIQKGLDPKYPDLFLWKPDIDGKTPVLEVGQGGIEVTIFNEKTEQDRHKHLIATEIYTILKGTMKMKIDGKELELSANDELVVLPGTIQEIISNGQKFVTRGRTINSYGNDDKYVEIDGKWRLAKEAK